VKSVSGLSADTEAETTASIAAAHKRMETNIDDPLKSDNLPVFGYEVDYWRN
jgi:hypothetical protein